MEGGALQTAVRNLAGVLPRGVVPRAALILGVLALSAHVLHLRLAEVDARAVMHSLQGLSLAQLLGGLLAVVLAFVAVAGQERAVLAHMSLPIPADRAGRAAIAAAAVSQTAGFGPVVGAIIRRRLLPELSVGQSFAVSAVITLGFFAGLGLFALACFAFVPGLPHGGPALAALLLAAGALGALIAWPGARIMGRRRPNAMLVGRFLFWLAIDLTALAVALWVLLPADGAPAFAALLPVFLVALGLGLVSGTPAGAGPFEATLLFYLPGVEQAHLMAGIIMFRAVAYALPALCGLVWAVLAPGRRAIATPALPVEIDRLAPCDLQALPRAETQLIRQNELALVALPGGGFWLTGALTHARVMLGSPVGAGQGSPGPQWRLRAVERMARAEGRLLCLYKTGPRMAAVARQAGHALLPIAREAIIDPRAFTTAGADRAGLRRKLARASRAGITIQAPRLAPLDEMEQVARDWRASHGQERGFSMGRWGRAYAAGQQVFTARDAGGRLIAFVTFHATPSEWVLDLVRFGDGTPDGTMYALICEAIACARAQSVPRLSLAAVPEPDLGLTGLPAFLVQRVWRGAPGLVQFKSAFAPRWERLYLAAPGRLSMVIAAAEILRAILRRSSSC